MLKKTDSLATRIKTLREEKKLTQEQLAEAVGLGRTSTTQWEAGRSEPPLGRIENLARILDTTPEYIAFGKRGPKAAETTYSIHEYVFGNTPSNRASVNVWGLPRQWIDVEVGARSPGELMVFAVPYQTVPAYEQGCRVLVDRSLTKITPPGYYLHWDGLGPTISHVSVGPPSGRKVTARVKTNEGDYEIEADKLQIIGRVIGAVSAKK